MAEGQWKGTTFGNGWMHRNLIRIVRVTGVRFLYIFSAVFVIPFCVVFIKSGKISYSFYRSRMGYGFFKSCWMSYRNHCKFSQIIVDRFAMYAGKTFRMEIEGNENIKEREVKDDGLVLLSSHIGNYELGGYTIRSAKKTFNAVVYSHEKESVMNNRNHMFDKTNVNMIAIQDDMSHLFEIDQALCRGDIVSFPADRYMPGTRCVTCDVFGEEAKLPQGPFSVATIRGVDVLAVNVMKTGARSYKTYVTPLQYDKDAPRKEQIKQLCREYVSEMERMIHMYPTQWFNFYDFWAQ